MEFTKPSLSFDQQVALLRSRGMGGDPTVIRRRLEAVNYYRLSAYWSTFRAQGGDQFIDGTTIDVVWARYTFDRELRLLVMDALERVEVAIRTRLAYAHAQAGGPFGYITGPTAITERGKTGQEVFLDRVDKALAANRKEPFVLHFTQTYGDKHLRPPIWVTAELLMFGDLVAAYKGSPPAIRRAVAHHFGVAEVVLDSWLLSLNMVRNICAHHGRLWNRELGIKPKIPRDDAWARPVKIPNERVFGVLTILADMMRRIAAGSTWSGRAQALIAMDPERVPIPYMGFPVDWQQSPVWQRAWAAADGVQPTHGLAKAPRPTAP
ncbi:MAG: Abi family protein [Deltaproteobacteria bacterium]|nr:Abi family protein [Deltaproteobacteria bacterium]